MSRTGKRTILLKMHMADPYRGEFYHERKFATRNNAEERVKSWKSVCEKHKDDERYKLLSVEYVELN